MTEFPAASPSQPPPETNGEAALLRALAELSRRFLAERELSLDAISAMVLDHARALTGSRFGFVGYIDPDTGNLVCPTLTRDVWEKCQVADKTTVFDTFSGLWGWGLGNRAALYTNNPAGDPRSTGIPEGHVPIERFLAVPAIAQDTLVGQVALANPGRDFDDTDLARIQQLADFYAIAVQRRRDDAALEQRVAERTRVLEESRARLGLFREILDRSTDAVFIIDRQSGRFVDVNQKACDNLGYTRQELLGLRVPDIEISLPDVPTWRRFVADPAHRDTVLEGEHRRKDGSTFPVEISVSDVTAQERPYRIAIARDISERKAREKETRRLLEILEATPDYVGIADPEGHIEYVNPGGQMLVNDSRHGTTPAESIGHYHPAWATEQVRTEGLDQAARDGVWQGETAVLTNDGQEIPASQIIIAHYDADGNIDHYSTIIRDIRERKAAEARVRREHTFIEAVLDSLPGIFYLVAPSGYLVRWNRNLEVVTGCSADEVASYHAMDYIAAEDRERARAALTEAFEAGETVLQARLLTAGGTAIPHVFTGRRVVLEDQPYMVGLGIDISERERYARRLEESNADLERFAYAVSHDLQEPLRMVSSYLGLIEHRYGETLDADAHTYLAYATDGARRMNRMIRDLLEYSRIHTRGEAVQPVAADDALDTALANLSQRIAETDATITRDPLPRVRADRGQLVRLFQNLVGNALKYHHPARPPRVHVSAARDTAAPDAWAFTVADNGAGIPADKRDAVFDVFYRGDRQGGTDGGSGIGLSLVKRIVERHDGRVWVESTEGEGSTFGFTLPAA